MTEASSTQVLDHLRAGVWGQIRNVVSILEDHGPTRWEIVDETLPLVLSANDPVTPELIHAALDRWRAIWHEAAEEVIARYRIEVIKLLSARAEAAKSSDEAQGPKAVQEA